MQPQTFGFQSYLRTLYQYTRHHLPLALLLVFIAGMTEGISLMLLLPLLASLGIGEAGESSLATFMRDSFSTTGIPFTLPYLLGVFLLLVILRSGIIYWRDVYLQRIELEFVDGLRTHLHQQLGKAGWLFLIKKRTSDLSHVLTSDITRIGYGTQLLLKMLVSATLGIAYLAVSLYLSFWLTLLTVTVGSFLLWSLRRHGHRALTLGQEHIEAGKAVFASVSEFLNGIKLVKSYGREQFYHDYFARVTTEQRKKQLAFQRNNSLAQQLFQISSAALLSGLLYVAITWLDTPTAHLLILAVIFIRLMPLLSGLQRSFEQIMHLLPAYTSAMLLTEECKAAAEPAPASSDPPELQQGISLQNVSFAYQAEETTLRQINLHIPVSQTTAIIGPSGSGKSTLADLLAGLMLPDQGCLYIDDMPLTEDNLALWRSAVAYVPQDVFLFHDTLRANMRWVAPESSDTDIWHVLELAAARKFVKRLPQGLDTVIGERGIRLSGGERQRIALARALLRKPKLLILDEATSALDNKHERMIQESIEALHGQLTIVMIAHRLSTIENADQVLSVEQGTVQVARPSASNEARSD